MYIRTPVGLLALLLPALLLVACGQRSEVGPGEVNATDRVDDVRTGKDEVSFRSAPDFGGIARVSREAEGIGSTPELAVLAALQSAIAQVNGVSVASGLQSVRAGLDVSDRGRAASMSTDAFMHEVMSASRGAVLSYEIVSQEEIDKFDSETISRVRASDEGFSYSASAAGNGSARVSTQTEGGSASASVGYSHRGGVEAKRGASSFGSDVEYKSMRSYWKARVKAEIAQYRSANEEGRPKIVISNPRTLSATYAVGDNRIVSDEVAHAIRSRLSETLTKTGRFIVLDREFGDEIQSELDNMDSGRVRPSDAARIGQQLATDLIVIPTIERFEYPRATRGLRMSDREVSSYSGGGRIALKVLNATTGEVVMSDSFEHRLDSTGPSTLPRAVDGGGMAAAMMDSLSEQIGLSVVTSIFPVSVVAVDGDQVVLSQGGDILEVGHRYQAVWLGDELKDPQTGRSLGRSERPCCVVHIDRVAAQTSYGTMEGAMAPVKEFLPGSIELRRQVKSAHREPAAVAEASSLGNHKPAVARESTVAPSPAATAEDPDW